jgi:hypothetical protein
MEALHVTAASKFNPEFMNVASDVTQKSRAMPPIPLAGVVKVLISAGLIAAVVYVVSTKSDLPSLSSFVSAFSIRDLIVVSIFLLIGALLSAWRLKLIAGDLGYRLTAADSIAAIGLGQIAGSIFFQIVGQLMARGALLARRGMPVAATVTMTVYERAAAAVVSLILAIGGAWYVFGRITLDMQHGGLPFLEIITGLLIAMAAGAWLGWGQQAISAAGRLKFDRSFTLPILRNIAVSTLIQLATMAAYVTAAHAIAPTIPLLDISAGSAVVMLVASLPISLSGWGVRELSAVFTLGVIGVPSPAALMVAVLIGVISLLVVGLFALTSFWSAPKPIAAPPPGANPRIDYGTLLAWPIPLLAATAVFFQIYVPVGSGVSLNVNLADPLAILGGALFLIGCVTQRRLPAWRLPEFNLYLALMTLAVTAALLNGVAAFGWTPWALTNRFFGWFILLGYGATGALLVRYSQRDGFKIILRIFAAVGASIVALSLFLILLTDFGLIAPKELPLRMSGFAQNPNAFAFQILLAFCATLLADFSRRQATLVMTLCFLGLWFAASRAVFVTLPVVAGLAYYLHILPLKRMLISLALGAAVVVAIYVTSADLAGWGLESAPFALSYEPSNAERVASLHGGLRLFLEHPLFGAGLGAFMAERIRDFGTPLVIHSTPLWLLAELGIVGFIIFMLPVIRIFFTEINRVRMGDPAAQILVLLIVVLGVMSEVHELLYQRGFWLLLGAALACTPIPAYQRRASRWAPSRSLNHAMDQPHVLPGSMHP